ncbi:MAG: HD domain-containing phosphohydrolase [Thermodesulfobacteriota bacterium]|nr:HD domain-containing phosphohydrolase [Thermodesulfobacteriota bacterium]
MKDIDIRDLADDKKLGRVLDTVVREVKMYAEDQIEHIKKLTDIGIALSGEKNINKLLEMIVDEARKLSGADAGTLYITEEKEKSLRFAILQNDSMKIRKGGVSGEAAEGLPNVPLFKPDGSPNHSNVSSYAALTGERVNIQDVYATEDFDFSGTKKYDVVTGYHCQSMLVIPLKNHEDKIIGVLQLLNATDRETGEIIAFPRDSIDLVGALASQAAVALTNMQLIEDLKALFYAFIKTIATAIDEKSPFTGGHINRVVNLTMEMAQAVSEADTGPLKDIIFTEDEMEELRIAAWMHDVGKITTPEHIVSKTNKLEGVFDRIELIETRFNYIIQKLENEKLKQKVKILEEGGDNFNADTAKELAALDNDYAEKIAAVQSDLDLLKAINSDKQMVDEASAALVNAIAARTYKMDGRPLPWLSENEAACLTILRGNLLEEERRIIEHHAEMTTKITRELPFPDKLANVPTYAGSHHEKLDGSGYPKGLSGDDIPIQARIIAIADVFEALTARDRPYKPPMNISQALKILGFMNKDGHIDPDIYDLFMREKLYQPYCEKELSPDQLD